MEAAQKFSLHKSTPARLWKQWQAARQSHPDGHFDVQSKKVHNSRPLKYDRQELREAIKKIPLPKRKTMASLSTALGVSAGTIHHLTRNEKLLKPHTSAVKPSLTDINKLERVEFCIQEEDADLPGIFKPFFDRIHDDEKWFFVDEVECKFYLLEDEEEPHRTTRHKSHIPKIMFLCAVARPRWDAHRGHRWDGKLGIWPFAKQVAAQRSSRNIPRGTLEWKPISVTKEVYREFLIEKLLPAIIELWPVGQRDQPILIQYDNAPSHIANDDPQFVAAAAATNLAIKLYSQPPNLPDLNVLDLR